MKKQFILAFLFELLFSQISIGQRTHVISLYPAIVPLVYGGFAITQVKDVRANKENIGEARIGFFHRETPIILEGGFYQTITEFYKTATPMVDGALKMTAHIKKIEISESLESSTEFAHVYLEIDYYLDSVLVYSNREEVDSHGLDVTKDHPSNLAIALKRSIVHLDRSGWNSKLIVDEITDTSFVVFQGGLEEPDIVDLAVWEREQKMKDLLAINPPEDLSLRVEDKNTVAIGYQVGGFSLIGINYEARIHNYVGLHAGAGLFGYTAGVKLHTSSDKNSTFFNANFKDGGFGLINTLGIELGGRLPFSKTGDFGLHYQLGFGRIRHVDPNFAAELFPLQDVPDFIFTFGIGFGW